MSRHLTAEEVEQERINAMGSELGSFFGLLAYECQMLYLEWLEYKVLFGTSPDRIALLNEAAPAFFGRIQNTLWEVILLRIARLMDPPNSGGSKENVTLLRLPRLVDPAIRCKLDILLGVAQENCAFSQDWRNRHIAHRDLRLALGESELPLPLVSRLSVGHAIEAIGAVLNAVESHYTNGTEVAYQYMESDSGAKALLYLLQDGLDARKTELEKMMSGEIPPMQIARKRTI